MNRGCFVLCLSWDTVHPGKPRVHRNQASSLILTISGHARRRSVTSSVAFLRRARRGSVLAAALTLDSPASAFLYVGDKVTAAIDA